MRRGGDAVVRDEGFGDEGDGAGDVEVGEGVGFVVVVVVVVIAVVAGEEAGDLHGDAFRGGGAGGAEDVGEGEVPGGKVGDGEVGDDVEGRDKAEKTGVKWCGGFRGEVVGEAPGGLRGEGDDAEDVDFGSGGVGGGVREGGVERDGGAVYVDYCQCPEGVWADGDEDEFVVLFVEGLDFDSAASKFGAAYQVAGAELC